MGLLARISGWLRPRPEAGLGLFLFDEVAGALRAERVLRGAGYELRLVAPPHALRAGCDLAVALDPTERPGAERTLERAGVPFRAWADSPAGALPIADLVTSVDFGRWLMIRAGNMKITVEKESGLIVNTSGGGCPDIPALNLALVGRTIWEAPRPREVGYTLCGLMLDRAFVEARGRLRPGGSP